jgi:hypothetical protein
MNDESNEDLSNVIEIICYSIAYQTALTNVINKIPNEEFIHGYIVGFSKRFLDSSSKLQNYTKETFDLILGAIFKNFYNHETVNKILSKIEDNLNNNETFKDGAYEAVEDVDSTISKTRSPVKLAMYIQRNEDLLSKFYSDSIENFYHKEKVYELGEVGMGHYNDYVNRVKNEN